MCYPYRHRLVEIYPPARTDDLSDKEVKIRYDKNTFDNRWITRRFNDKRIAMTEQFDIAMSHR